MIKRKKLQLALIVASVLMAFGVLFFVFKFGTTWLFLRTLEYGLGSEKFVYSYDQKFCYLPMSSEKKKLCTLNIYETEIEQIPGGKSRIIPGDLTYIFPYYYDGNRIEYISWGKENYNIYFKSAEVGEFCYIYQDGEWKGPQEWDISSTIDLLDLQKQ